MTRRRWIAGTYTETTASLIGAQAEHLTRVLRAQVGTEAEIVAGSRVWRASIREVSMDEVRFELLEELTAEPALNVALLLAVFKFDRMEWAIEKAAELDVATIVPIVARRSEKHLALAAAKRVERWRRVAHEAAQQSRRTDVPLIADPIALASQLKLPSAAHGIVLAEEERAATLRQRIMETMAQATTSPEMAFAIGPEGGWTDEEMTLFARHGWQPATLGPRILRAETAAIAALAIASALLRR